MATFCGKTHTLTDTLAFFTGWLYNQKGTYFIVPARTELTGLSKEALLALLISSHTDLPHGGLNHLKLQNKSPTPNILDPLIYEKFTYNSLAPSHPLVT